MKAEDFTSSAPGRLVRASGPGGEHLAFIPNALPPDLVINRGLAVAISEADRALGELAGVGRNLSNPQMLVQPFIRREAVLSSRIEGTKADIADVYAFEAGQKMSAAEVDDAREVTNYVRATELGLHALENRPMTSGLLRELHRALLEGVRGDADRPGEFRDCPVFIGSNHRMDDARFVPPPVVHLRAALDEFDRYLALPHDYPPLVRLALLHYQFEAIHPFRDGNGRIGRLLLGLLLVHWQLLPLPLLSLSAYLEHNRRAYYDHLLSISTRGAWTDWIHFFALGVLEQSRDAADRAKRLQDLQSLWRSKAQMTPHVSRALLKAVDLLFEAPYVDAASLEERLGVSHPTALKTLRKLSELEFVAEVTGRSRGQLFRADGIVTIVK